MHGDTDTAVTSVVVVLLVWSGRGCKAGRRRAANVEITEPRECEAKHSSGEYDNLMDVSDVS